MIKLSFVDLAVHNIAHYNLKLRVIKISKPHEVSKGYNNVKVITGV